MLPSFFQEVWRRLQASGAHPNQPSACLAPADAVNLVIEATFPGLRAMPGFPARLQDPVMRAMNYIGDMVEQLPTAISCRRSSYVSLPEVNALFSGPDQIQQVFSANDAVRALFDQYPDLDQCWVLLCAQKQERHQFGMALCGDQVRREGPARRFIYIRVGQLAGESSSPWSRRMKIDIHDIANDLLDRAADGGGVIETTVIGTGKDGTPACATVRPTGWRIVER
jgi:hypothetical protein